MGIECDWLFKFAVGDHSFNSFCVLILIACVLTQNLGTSKAGKCNSVINIVKIILISLVIVVAMSKFESKYLTPFTIESQNNSAIAGFLRSSTILYYCFIGFDFITCLSDEALNPVRDVPKALIYSVSLIIILFTLFATFVSGVGDLSRTRNNGDTAVVDVFEARGLKWMSMIIVVMAIISMYVCNFLGMIGLSRFNYNFAKDGLFFSVFKELDPVRRVPVAGAWLQVVPIMVAAAFFDIKVLAQVTSLCQLMIYVAINASILQLRLNPPHQEGPKNFTRSYCSLLFILLSLCLCLSYLYGWSNFIISLLTCSIVIVFSCLHLEISK